MLQRTTISVRCAEAKVLLAAEPSPQEHGMSILPFATEEITEVRNILPPGAVITIPPHQYSSLDVMGGTTVQGLLDGLPDANILHLACHGSQNATNPLESAFHLRDGSLTIAQIMPVPLPRAFLAFLSACETARGDMNYAEQVIHLGAAMLFAGFKSVVGTMW
jgi:CHAT domain-containing protein